jgi:hypothetical protein
LIKLTSRWHVSPIQQARGAALDQARLSGKLAAMQRQLQDQAAIIERLTACKLQDRTGCWPLLVN